MEAGLRKPFQGVINIIRFNWHFYALAALSVISIFIVSRHFISFRLIAHITALLIACSVISSLAVSFYIYDCSNLYKLSWLDDDCHDQVILNINAGFDETTTLLQHKFKTCKIIPLDFYDPVKHTEVSIKRARKAYPPPYQQQITTDHVPLAAATADRIFTILSAHEIRNNKERTAFFRELHRILQPAGQIIVTEHLRDPANLLAYNIGFFHFHSRATWIRTFQSAGLHLVKEVKVTPFISSFILQKNGMAS